MDTVIDPQRLMQLATALGLSISADQETALGIYARFLATEGMAAGGIGPHELDRLYDRHIADSLAFLACIDETTRTVADVGSGIGLPGIPIAIVCPGMSVTLIDRSQGRCDLARRAVRMARLGNVDVRQVDVSAVTDRFDTVIFRASLPLDAALGVLPDLLARGGEAIFGLSRRSEPPDMGDIAGRVSADWSIELVEALTGVLDSPAWLLRISPT